MRRRERMRGLSALAGIAILGCCVSAFADEDRCLIAKVEGKEVALEVDATHDARGRDVEPKLRGVSCQQNALRVADEYARKTPPCPEGKNTFRFTVTWGAKAWEKTAFCAKR
jgi:hypothetical protein